jgi:hypothetical protein
VADEAVLKKVLQNSKNPLKKKNKGFSLRLLLLSVFSFSEFSRRQRRGTELNS